MGRWSTTSSPRDAGRSISPYTGQWNRESPQARGLTAWWPFQGADAAQFQDVIGGRRLVQTGTLTRGFGGNFAQGHTAGASAAAAPDPPMDYAIERTASSYLRADGLAPIALLEQCTVMGWCYQIPNGDGRWFCYGTSSNTGIQLGTELYAPAVRRGEDGSLVVTSGLQWANDLWRHVAVTDDGTTVRIYVNGKEAANTTNATANGTITSVGAIGGNNHSGYPDAAITTGMRLTDLRFYNRVLSAEEIRAIHAVQTRWDLYAARSTRVYIPAAGGTQSYSYTATGGLSLGGVAVVVRGRVVAAAGGLQLGGAAPVQYHESTRTVVASGGLTLGGAASYEANSFGTVSEWLVTYRRRGRR